MRYYSSAMNDSIMCKNWMEFGIIIMVTISQIQKAKNHVFGHMWNLADNEYNDKNKVTEAKYRFSRGNQWEGRLGKGEGTGGQRTSK
jgi:hypothetical protein